MSHSTSDPDVLREILHVRTLRSVIHAVRRLGLVARGHRGCYCHELQLRACVELARLAPTMLRADVEPKAVHNPIHPASRHMADQLMDEMEAIRADCDRNPDRVKPRMDFSHVSID